MAAEALRPLGRQAANGCCLIVENVGADGPELGVLAAFSLRLGSRSHLVQRLPHPELSPFPTGKK